MTTQGYGPVFEERKKRQLEPWGRVRKPAAQLEEEELETTDDDDDEDLILCRYSVAEFTGVSGKMATGSEYIPV